MTEIAPKPAGYYLALPYFLHPENPLANIKGLNLPQAVDNPEIMKGLNWIFCGAQLLLAPHWPELLKIWFAHLADKGVLALYVPDVRFMETLPGAPRLTLETIVAVLAGFKNAVLLESDVVQNHAFVVLRKDKAVEGFVGQPWRKKEKHLLFIRFGALGDALMAASVLPYFKSQGYAITAFVSAAGHEVLKNDPHIDEFHILLQEQLSEQERGIFYAVWASRFDKFVNLAASCEGHLLPRPRADNFYWSDEQRRRNCGGSYLAFTHSVAGAPPPYRVKFYANVEEKKWAAEKKKELGPFLFWQLKGAHFHKWWPYVAEAACQLLSKTDLTLVLSGDEESFALSHQITEAAQKFLGIDTKTRLKNLIAQKSIRFAMELAKQAELVIGPETALMHAVSLEPVAKILQLSHSSHANLSVDWVNTRVVLPTSPCWPCHRLHDTAHTCFTDAATGASACMASVPAKKIVEAVLEMLQPQKSEIETARPKLHAVA